MVICPICDKGVKSSRINDHIDSGCETFLLEAETQDKDTHPSGAAANESGSRTPTPPSITQSFFAPSTQKRSASTFFQTPAAKRQAGTNGKIFTPIVNGTSTTTATVTKKGVKRTFDEGPGHRSSSPTAEATSKAEAKEKSEIDAQDEGEQAGPNPTTTFSPIAPVIKRTKTNRAAPLAERMRPKSLDDVFGQDLVGPHGVLRALIDADRVPSMILWGGSGTGKTTIARCLARRIGPSTRFVELNATSCGVAECKKLFSEAASELALTGRRTVIFCDEIHRFNKAQQDVFLKPVETGTITLVGATTENPSFKVQAALLSRCRTFTLRPLEPEDLHKILARALQEEVDAAGGQPPGPLVDDELLAYLSRFADGDARAALNLLENTLSLSRQAAPPPTQEELKRALTKTMVYDRAGDQHYDTISAFHKAVRGSDADAALYYLARMLQSGEDPLFVARRMVVIASEDVGLADNSLLPLATAAYTAAQQIGMPEARIPLAHCCVALCLAPKSTRAYRGLNAAFSALQEPGVAALPVPLHLRNAPTRLMREMGYGAEYKYPPNYKDGRVKQEYLPEALRGRRFLEERDLGTEVDPDLDMLDADEGVGGGEKGD